ncbi:WD40 repeat-like protein [Auricularia subglabra TFB-10046 SS5]|uniref:WD40 repeat-like protein n=1 Tax=Auricularia subglabra (strain TFB-10046 / SS5) TaxID=717982 RepID=J0D844_AURST|nr:WD40 repeat-like protein [Auricularia subglabra TFB-10046 SS5]
MSITWIPGGACLALALLDGTIRVWNSAERVTVAEIVLDKRAIRAVAASADGSRIACAADDFAIYQWSALSYIPLGKPMRGHSDRVWCVAYSPIGGRIVSASSDRTLRLWHSSTGSPIGQPMRGHQGSVLCLAFSPNGRRIASGSTDATVRLWSARAGVLLATLSMHEDTVTSLCFSPSGTYLVSGSLDKTLRVYKMAPSRELRYTIRGHSLGISSLAVTPDYIISGSYDQTVRCWDPETGSPLSTLFAENAGVILSATVSPNGESLLFSSFNDCNISIWPLYGGAGPFQQSFCTCAHYQCHEERTRDFPPAQETM